MQLFSHISCYHTGSLDPGLLIIEGKVLDGIEIETANQSLEKELAKLVEEEISDVELEKAKNKIESLIVFEDMQLLARANNLAFYELLGDAGMMNTELEKYLHVSKKDIKEVSGKIFHPKNSNTLFYLRKSV
jgi:zinc protease